MGKNKNKCKPGAKVSSEYKVSVQENPEDVYKQHPLWSFTKLDFEHDRWALTGHKDDVEKLIKKLRDYERMTWNDIFCDTCGRKGNTKNHLIHFSDLSLEAQKRASELKIDDYDGIYSLTITGKRRMFGIMENNVFYIVWDDLKHEICPSHKSHT